MIHKEKHLDNKRRRGSDKKKKKYENNSILVEKEIYIVANVGKSTKNELLYL